MYFAHPISPSPFLGESRVEDSKWMDLFQDNINVNWLTTGDLTTSNEPTCTELAYTDQASTVPATEPTSTAAPTTDNVSVAFLSTTSLVPGPESPHADICEIFTRACRKVEYPIAHYMSTHRLSKACQAFANQMSTVAIPNKVQDALSDSKWDRAMTEEMQAFKKNKTWELVQLPEAKKLVDCRWIYIIKHKPNGSIDRYKAKLVAQGFPRLMGDLQEEVYISLPLR
ncbi:hypothetical protein L3X38_004682 [Prunus dulcis]|uniref:Reverse transcriptase Ty1/copia-type domain-containing protein n=1 Tax=Prunus dulcis TaxID=3755 RepID=A0AAD4ZPH9_PRUDU|nr:hypothetical protein L3X38_004682 [Prunus dulcis]